MTKRRKHTHTQFKLNINIIYINASIIVIVFIFTNNYSILTTQIISKQIIYENDLSDIISFFHFLRTLG